MVYSENSRCGRPCLLPRLLVHLGINKNRQRDLFGPLLLRGLIAQAVTKRVKAQRKNQVLNSEETKDKNKMNMNESKVYEFRVTGMTCTHCRSFVEKSIKLVSGVETVKVDLASGIAEVRGSATEKEIIQAVEEAGFGISVI